MKPIKNEAGETTHWMAETEDESAAIEYVKTHVPLFAGSESYGMAAFQAGAAWERARQAREAHEAETAAQWADCAAADEFSENAEQQHLAETDE